VLGPTASGKSALAAAIAAEVGGEIVSVDSMQVYRGMDIGTAKPSSGEREVIRHHLIDIADPVTEFTAVAFQAAGRRVMDGIAARGRTAVIVGGSGLHFRSLIDPLTFAPTDEALRDLLEAEDAEALRRELLTADPDAAAVVDLDNRRRVLRAVEVLRLTGQTPTHRAGGDEAAAIRSYRSQRPFLAVGLDPGVQLADRVVARFDGMLEAGLLAEVASLCGRMGRTAAQAVGYRELLPVVAGESALEDARERTIDATLALAKRQRTFFRRDPRVRWLPWHHDLGTMVERARRVLEAAWTF
jgi:tRNA dimethylallyltransferase